MRIVVEHGSRKFVVVGFIGVVNKMMSAVCDQCFCVTAVLQVAQGFASGLQAMTSGQVGENLADRIVARAIKRCWSCGSSVARAP